MKNKKFTLRFRLSLILNKWYDKNKYMISAMVLGLLVGSLSTFALLMPNTTPLEALETSIEVKAVESIETLNKYQLRGYSRCYDPIICIRDIGEEMGMSNKDIKIAVRIAKAESGYRTDAINLNRNRTADLGVFQINDVHGKRISRADRFDMEKNITFAYKLRLEQKSWNAWSTCHNGMVDCSL